MDQFTGHVDAALPMERRVALLQDALREIGRFCTELEPLERTVPQPARQAPEIRQERGAGQDHAVDDAADISLRQFLSGVDELTEEERERLVEAALTMIEHVYVHLPLKRAMYAIEPVRRLGLLRQQLSEKSPRRFHDEMISIFHSLRDLHTNYILPRSHQGKTAFLPFLVEECFEGQPPQRRFIVTKLVHGFQHADFGPGVPLTHWNGIPIERAVELNAEREAGSNADARQARGLEALTIRPMALTSPPDEEWVTIGFEANGRPCELRLEWKVFEPPPSPSGVDLTAVGIDMARVMGVDALTEAVRRAKKSLFLPEEIDKERRMAAVAAAGLSTLATPPEDGGPNALGEGLGVDVRAEVARRAKKSLFVPETIAAERPRDQDAALAAAEDNSLMPDVFAFRRVEGPNGALGYIRIWTFLVQDADAFVAEFVRIARRLPQTGLIIDVRGNGGGNILAGEKLLQVLTPRAIDPERLHFIATPTTVELCRGAPPGFGLQKWIAPLELALRTGDNYSQGYSLDEAEDYNQMGQQYQGPVVLITDALCYSTTDIFATGFQDHGIGTILGVHRRTGAGGANVWEHSLLEQLLPATFVPLPKRASFRVAIRRMTRAKDRAGMPVEDLGVEADERYLMSRRDILEGNTDLIAKAAQLIAREKVRSLSAQVDRSEPAAVRIRVSAMNVSRIDAYHEGRPLSTADVQGGTATLVLPTGVEASGALEVLGYDGESLVVATRIQV